MPLATEVPFALFLGGHVVRGRIDAVFDDGAGRCHGRFTVPSHVGAMLRRHLLALANPARHTDDDRVNSAG